MNVGVILAGGAGSKVVSDASWSGRLRTLAGASVLSRQARLFDACPDIDVIRLAYPEDGIKRLEREAAAWGIEKPLHVIPAGGTRRRSILAALEGLASVCREDDIVVVHDAVRIFIMPDSLTRVARAARRTGSAVRVFPMDEGCLTPENGGSALPRDDLYAVQTPHGFLFGLGLAVYREAEERGLGFGHSGGDLFALMEKEVAMVKGSRLNVKLSFEADSAYLSAVDAVFASLDGDEGDLAAGYGGTRA